METMIDAERNGFMPKKVESACPSCGGDCIVTNSGNGYQCRCQNCGGETPMCNSARTAVREMQDGDIMRFDNDDASGARLMRMMKKRS